MNIEDKNSAATSQYKEIGAAKYALPIGISDFEKVIKSKAIFVDKSLFIRDILQTKTEVTLITRPRRFGKTLNLSMLKYFLKLESQYQLQNKTTKAENSKLTLAPNNNPALAPNSRPNLTLNSNQTLAPNIRLKDLFNGLKIASELLICQEHQNQYPVIFISFKDIKAESFEIACEDIQDLIRELYAEHRYLLEDDLLNPEDQERYLNVLNCRGGVRELKTALSNLIKYLKYKFGRNVVLLIDEYDTPLQTAYLYNYYESMQVLLANMFSKALKDNEHLQRAVLTGITRISQASLFSGMNNIAFCSILRDKYNEYFGFTEDEVIKLIDQLYFNNRNDFELKKKHCSMTRNEIVASLRSWYNGYNVGQATVYNPWSIISCLNKKIKLRPYWLNTANHTLLERLLCEAKYNIKQELQKLINGEIIELEISENLIFPKLMTNSASLWTLLVATGYLTVRSIVNNGINILAKLQIPNKEVSFVYDNIITEWFDERLVINAYHDFLHSLVNWQEEEFRKYLQDYLLESVSYYDLIISKNNNEQVFHTLILGLVAGLRQNYIIQSNREAGAGRCDLMLIPKSQEQTSCQHSHQHHHTQQPHQQRLSIIMEFKLAKTPKQITEQAQAAMAQIKDKQYMAAVRSFLPTNGRVHLLGLAFCGKDFELVSEFIDLG